MLAVELVVDNSDPDDNFMSRSASHFFHISRVPKIYAPPKRRKWGGMCVSLHLSDYTKRTGAVGMLFP